MAQRSIFACFLFFVALLVGLTSSNAQGIGTGVSVNCSVLLNISGILVCSPTGNLPGNPLVGVNVTLVCNNKTVAQATTIPPGFFQLTVNVTNLLPLNLSSCRIVVPLPLNTSCIALPNLGSLVALISPPTITQTPGGFILNFVGFNFTLFPPILPPIIPPIIPLPPILPLPPIIP